MERDVFFELGSVEQGFAVEHDDKVVAIGGDVVAVPLVRQDLRGSRLLRSHQTAREKTGGLIIPDLQFVTCDMRLPLLLRPQENAAVYLLSSAELQFQLVIGKRGVAAQPTGRLSTADDRAIFDSPIR